jgi:Family of unknown function (DUF6719)
MPHYSEAMVHSRLLLACLMLLALVRPAAAQQVAREQDIADLRLGQRIMVDDGSCPAGQIKEVTGVKLTSSGVSRARRCVPRMGTKK